MCYTVIIESFKDIFDHPFIKTIIAALSSLLFTPAFLIVAILIFWTLDLFSELVRGKKTGDIVLEGLYNRIIAQVIVLIGLTVLANMSAAPFVQVYGYGLVCTTEYIQVISNLYGKNKAKRIIRGLIDRAGLDPEPHLNDSPPATNDND